jgi:hypothetical protein
MTFYFDSIKMDPSFDHNIALNVSHGAVSDWKNRKRRHIAGTLAAMTPPQDPSEDVKQYEALKNENAMLRQELGDLYLENRLLNNYSTRSPRQNVKWARFIWIRHENLRSPTRLRLLCSCYPDGAQWLRSEFQYFYLFSLRR